MILTSYLITMFSPVDSIPVSHRSILFNALVSPKLKEAWVKRTPEKPLLFFTINLPDSRSSYGVYSREGLEAFVEEHDLEGSFSKVKYILEPFDGPPVVSVVVHYINPRDTEELSCYRFSEEDIKGKEILLGKCPPIGETSEWFSERVLGSTFDSLQKEYNVLGAFEDLQEAKELPIIWSNQGTEVKRFTMTYAQAKTFYRKYLLGLDHYAKLQEAVKEKSHGGSQVALFVVENYFLPHVLIVRYQKEGDKYVRVK